MAKIKTLRFSDHVVAKTPAAGLDVETTLRHFSIITYAVEPASLRPHIDQRFDLNLIRDKRGHEKALISVVPFLDRDFRCRRWPRARFHFGQTNYRAYVRDRKSGANVVWFFGTVLDSPLVTIPKYWWGLPWHRARMSIDCRYKESSCRYQSYEIQARSSWAPAKIRLRDTGEPPAELEGFTDVESGLVLLTHPLLGYFYRRDGRLGTYRVWHDRMQPTVGTVEEAWFPRLERLGLVTAEDCGNIHSVLMQPEIDFTIYLPPSRVK